MSNSRLKNTLSPLSRILPLEKGIPFNGKRFIFPFWHAVSDAPNSHLSQLYRVPTVSEFERDLDFLLKNFKSASTKDVLQYSQQPEILRPKLFFPTFDDGLAECFHVIAPILKRKGIDAVFFINPSFVDNKSLFHRHKASLILKVINENQFKPAEQKEAELLVKQEKANKNLQEFLRRAVFTDHPLLDRIAAIFGIDFNHFLASHQPYMTLAQIKELQADGFLIGAHSMDHREFFLSSEEEIYRQIIASMYFLIQEINPELKTFAFPFTDFKVPDSVFEKANQSKIWDLSFGTAGIKDEQIANHIQRIPMESGNFSNAKQLIRTEYIWYYLKTILGKNKVRRQ